jgi:uncharacterized membrane protein
MIRTKVRHALNEARMLVLGVQVLLGFEMRAFFEPRFDALPPAERWLKLAGFSVLLGVLGLLLAPAARHRLVEQGRDTAAFHRFVQGCMELALLPFALVMALEYALAAARLAGPLAALAAGGAALGVAIVLWYVIPLLQRRPPSREERPMDEGAEKTKLEDRIEQVLTEARVVLPGAQALLGFQFAIFLMQEFDKLPPLSRTVHFASLACVGAAATALMAPAAYHRIAERGEDTERLHSFASAMVLVALGALALGFAGDMFVVVRKLTGSDEVAAGAAALTLTLLLGLWFGLALLLRARRMGRGNGHVGARDARVHA